MWSLAELHMPRWCYHRQTKTHVWHKCLSSDVRRYAGELRAFCSTLICTLIWISAPKLPLGYFCTCPVSQKKKKKNPFTILSRNSPELSMTKEKVGFLSQWGTWTAMTFTCWVYSSNTPHLKWPQCPATVPLLCAQCKYWGPSSRTSVIWTYRKCASACRPQFISIKGHGVSEEDASRSVNEMSCLTGCVSSAQRSGLPLARLGHTHLNIRQ